jgi:hypothetical protein
MNCPNCNSDAGFETHPGAGQDPETGYYDADYLACIECGAETDIAEIERINAPEERISPASEIKRPARLQEIA